jgi:hypothetical protein
MVGPSPDGPAVQLTVKKLLAIAPKRLPISSERIAALASLADDFASVVHSSKFVLELDASVQCSETKRNQPSLQIGVTVVAKNGAIGFDVSFRERSQLNVLSQTATVTVVLSIPSWSRMACGASLIGVGNAC